MGELLWAMLKSKFGAHYADFLQEVDAYTKSL
jgi:hypothetical protein